MLLTELRPSRDLYFMAYEMLRDLSHHHEEQCDQRIERAKLEITRLARKADQLMDRPVDADSPALVTAYENRIRVLEENRTALSDKINNCGRLVASFEETYRTAMQFLANPSKLWSSEHLADKRPLLKLVFAGKLPQPQK